MTFFSRQPSFPVDAVFTWVNGADPVWREQKRLLRQKLFGERDIPKDADDESRFRDNDELRYALRSLARCAPWIRTVHLVTADQQPSWLNPHSVNLVSHRDIFPETVPLPVFSCHPIELCLHRTPGLAEHFISCNDDFMFGRPALPGDFFLPDGAPLLWVVKRGRKSMARMRGRMDGADPRASAVARAHALISARCNLVLPYAIRHFPRSMTRSSVASLWEAFPEAIGATLRSPFRSPDDVAVSTLYPLYALASGIGRARVVNGVRQVLDAVSGRGAAHLGASIGDGKMDGKMRLIRMLRPRTFCLNDARGASAADRDKARAFLATMFPAPCKYETPGI